MTTSRSEEPVLNSEPAYHEGFFAAQQGEPLFPDADPIYAAGWNGYWTARWALGGATPETRAFYGVPAEDLTPEGIQLVIPGTERIAPATQKQLDLF